MAARVVCLFIVAFISIVSSQDEAKPVFLTGIKPCTGTKGAPPAVAQVAVTGCESQPCRLVKGQMVEFIYKFTAARSTPEVFNNFVGALGFGLAPFKGFHLESACQYLKDDDFPDTPACPVQKNHNYTYDAKIPISKTFPSIDVVVESGVFEADKKRPLTCFQMKVKLVTA